MVHSTVSSKEDKKSFIEWCEVNINEITISQQWYKVNVKYWNFFIRCLKCLLVYLITINLHATYIWNLVKLILIPLMNEWCNYFNIETWYILKIKRKCMLPREESRQTSPNLTLENLYVAHLLAVKVMTWQTEQTSKFLLK